MTTSESTERKKPSVWIMLIALVPLVAAAIQMSIAKASSTGADGSLDWSEIGAQGDWWGGHFGAAAALTSAILFFYAIWLQHTELQETRKEMRMARSVYQAQKEQLTRQADIAEKAAISAHIIAIAEVRRPWLDAWCKAHKTDTILNVSRRSSIVNEILPYDRYIHSLLDSPLFTDDDRRHYKNMFWLGDKETLPPEEEPTDDALEILARNYRIRTRAKMVEDSV